MTEGGCGVVGSSNIGLGVGGVVTGIGNPN